MGNLENKSGNSSNKKEETSEFVQSWLLSKGVHTLTTIRGDETSSSQWLEQMGVMEQSDRFINSQIVTQNFLGHNKDFGEGWFRGGGESFYKICEVFYWHGEKQAKELVAFKAIHSMGNIHNKIVTEAVWMSHMASLGVCSKVFAVGNGIIVKEFLEEDPPERRMSPPQHTQAVAIIHDLLTRVGLTPNSPIEVIQHHGKLMIIDLGSGDISGPDAFTFIGNLQSQG